MTYELRIKSDSDSDIQPTVMSLESPLVKSVQGIDADRVRIELVDGADSAAYEAVMDADADVYEYERV